MVAEQMPMERGTNIRACESGAASGYFTFILNENNAIFSSSDGGGTKVNDNAKQGSGRGILSHNVHGGARLREIRHVFP